MYQEIIKIMVFKVSDEQEQDPETFARNDNTFIGEVHLMWKKCHNTEGENGASIAYEFT